MKMRGLSRLGIGLSLVSTFLFLALMAELYYLLWYKKRSRSNPNISDNSSSSSSRELLHHLFCFKKPASLTSTVVLNPQVHTSTLTAAENCNNGQEEGEEEEESMEAQLMRLHSLAGPPRLLFTIKEETKEDLESQDGRRGRSLGDLFNSSETPMFLSPLSSPILSSPSAMMHHAMYSSYKQQGFNPLFETASPPPKFQFMKDAEEKMHKKAMMEDALRSQKSGSIGNGGDAASPNGVDEEDGSYITIVIGKNRDRGHHHHLGPSQVTPLPSSPSKIRNCS